MKIEFKYYKHRLSFNLYVSSSIQIDQRVTSGYLNANKI